MFYKGSDMPTVSRDSLGAREDQVGLSGYKMGSSQMSYLPPCPPIIYSMGWLAMHAEYRRQYWKE
jgi:hypothetical protein